jgi:L-2-hydroxyglutarate oxidase LhgO
MQVQTCVVGAGVVGLAVARALALAGQEVVVLEAARAVGTGTSSRNSEVVHAGLYYKQGSLKARACVEGRRRLYEYCDSRGVAYRRCGKLIVATSEAERALLEGILGAGEANGVEGLRLLSAEEACDLEPELRCVGGALLSPATGIVDSHGLMLALQGDAEAGGAVVALESAVEAAEVVRGSGIALQVGGERLLCDRVVNAAGLHAPALAAALRGAGAAHAAQVPVARFARGCYFALQGQPSPFSRLVYPVPDPTGAGLGVHATVDLGGLTRFGPNVEWLDDGDGGGGGGGVGAQQRLFGGAAAAAAAAAEGTEGGGGGGGGGWAAALAAERAAVERAYVVDPAGADSFYGAVRRYWPALQDGALAPDYAGIRPKLSLRGAAEDFRVVTEAQHGVRGLVHLFGIESPGLTASLALADHVARALLEDGGGR